MDEKKLREQVHYAIDTHSPAYSPDPYRVQRVLHAANTGGRVIVKNKKSIAFVLMLIFMLMSLTALAVTLLSPQEVVEQVAVPTAQNNKQENYSREELSELIAILNENGISLDDESIVLKALASGHGYWEKDTIREICTIAFGSDRGVWTLEQKHWYGEMMTAIGAWDVNKYLLPAEGELTQEEAYALAASTLKNLYGVSIPEGGDETWRVSAGFSLVWNEETQSMNREDARWQFTISKQAEPNRTIYSISFDRFGNSLDTYYFPEEACEASSVPHPLYEKEEQAIASYGQVYHFWPPEVLTEVFGETYRLPAQSDYNRALYMAMDYITDRYGADALLNLEGYYTGFVYQQFEDVETNATQKNWDFMFTTDREYLSDGYRVQFRWIIDHSTGEESTIDVCIEHANLGAG